MKRCQLEHKTDFDDTVDVTTTSKSYIPKRFYDRTKYLHKLPKLKTSCTGIKYVMEG